MLSINLMIFTENGFEYSGVETTYVLSRDFTSHIKQGSFFKAGNIIKQWNAFCKTSNCSNVLFISRAYVKSVIRASHENDDLIIKS